jgi:hypothetical protein
MQKPRKPPRPKAKPVAKAAVTSPAKKAGGAPQLKVPAPREVHIAGYKSIEELRLELGRVTVFIGENGCGKTNVLEAIALGAAAAAARLEHEFLASRGVRVTEPRFMRSAFPESPPDAPIHVEIRGADKEVLFSCSLQTKDDVSPLTRMDSGAFEALPEGEREALVERVAALETERLLTEIDIVVGSAEPVAGWSDKARAAAVKLAHAGARQRSISTFLLYAPENTALRTFQAEGQILPLGVKGEGLFAHLRNLAQKDEPTLLEIIDRLSLLDWFDRFDIPKDLGPGERSLRIRDRYLAEGALFDQRSANEGFLMLLYYLTLFASPQTPRFFAVDNIDAALNPKLCSRLVETLVALAKKHDKQAILTTHNPAVLDGLDLHDDEQRLFVIERDRRGRTQARRVQPPRAIDGEPPMKLSEAFLRGYIGGLPKNF